MGVLYVRSIYRIDLLKYFDKKKLFCVHALQKSVFVVKFYNCIKFYNCKYLWGNFTIVKQILFDFFLKLFSKLRKYKKISFKFRVSQCIFGKKYNILHQTLVSFRLSTPQCLVPKQINNCE